MAPEAPELSTWADLFPPRPAWMTKGACRSRPDVTWFPARRVGGAPSKAVCAGCPALALCLECAIETDADGVWGGTSSQERRMRRLPLSC